MQSEIGWVDTGNSQDNQVLGKEALKPSQFASTSMASESVEKSTKKQLSPLIGKLLSEPVTFKAARYPDTVTIKPSSYIRFGKTNEKRKRPDVLENTDKVKAKKRKIPRSVAEAVAMYGRGNRSEDSDSKKSDKKDRKGEKKVKHDTKDNTTLTLADVNSDSLSDEDYVAGDPDSDEEFHTAEEEDSDEDSRGDGENSREDNENSSEADAKSREAGEKSQESDRENSPADGEERENSRDSPESMRELGRQLREDIRENAGDESGPDIKPDLEPGIIPVSHPEDYWGLNERDDDRGSNGCTRIYKSWREFTGRPAAVGLLNHGVTCYMNSAVQAMCHIPALMHYLVDVHQGAPGTEGIRPRSVTRVLADTACKMYQVGRKTDRKVLYINPKKLIRKLEDINCMMSEWRQEDSHEYFMSLMSRMQEDSTPKGVKLNRSIIYDIFGGLLTQTVTCTNCGHISTTQQEFYDLSLSLETKRRRASNMLDIRQMYALRKQIDASDDAGKSKQQLRELLKERILESERILGQESPDGSKKSSREGSEKSDSKDDSGEDSSKAGKGSSVESKESTKSGKSGQSSKSGEDSNESLSSDESTKSSSKSPQSPSSHSPSYSVQMAIRDFFSPELIRTDKRDRSGYVCEHCNHTTTAVKFSTIERAPETLAVHLKRFRFNGTSSMKVKGNVAYPETLDLSQYTTSMKMPVRYQLIAVIIHQGRSVSSGHYIAHCRQPDGGWATYDDDYVNRIKPAEAFSDPSAYVLVYSRLTSKSVLPAASKGRGGKRRRNGKGRKRRKLRRR